MGLQRKITPVSLLFTSLSCMIGSGWLFGAYYTAQLAGPAAIISWIIGGVLVMLLALSFSELGTLLPFDGGIARYTHFSHGGTVSFCMTWLAWLSCVAVAPTEVQAILQYSSHYWPWLTHTVEQVIVLTPKGLAIAAVLLFILSWINTRGITLLMHCNNLITLWKLSIPLLTVIVIAHVKFTPSNFTLYGVMPYGWHGVLASLPAAVIFSYLGFREATSLAGETANPKRAIPLAVLGSVAICMLLYVLIQIAFIAAVSPNMLVDGWQYLHFVGDAGPFAGIALALGLTWLSWMIYTDAIISPSGTGLIYTATTARLNYAMSHNHQISKRMAVLNQQGMPMNAIILNYCIGLLLFFPFPGWQALIKFQSVAIVLAYSVGPLSLMALRAQLPNRQRPFKVPVYRVHSILVFYICNLLAYWAGWATLWRILVALTIGLIFFLLNQYRLSRQCQDLSHALWLLPHFGLLALVSYLGNFGGIGLLSFGWDFVCLALVTLLVFVLAYRARLPAGDCQRAVEACHE